MSTLEIAMALVAWESMYESWIQHPDGPECLARAAVHDLMWVGKGENA